MNRKSKILVVDDDATYRQLITYQLTRAGYEVLIAHDGLQALDWLKHSPQRPDLLLLDLLMPRFSGLEVLAYTKSLPYKLPVILLSGAELPIVRQGVAQASPDAFLTKPFTMEKMLAQIEALLEPA